ncbi:flavodoxin [Breznakiellaceae bacterium SP9]
MRKLLLLTLTIFCMEAKMELNAQTQGSKKILVAYFSWGGNTRGIAQKIEAQLKTQGASVDVFVIEPVKAYSSNYNTCLEEAQRDQRAQARPPLKNSIANMAQYDTIILGYPNWWASIPMPIATFLESYDFSGKTIIPFCSHGGGRFGQSLTAIAKLAPRAKIAEGLSVNYSGGNSLPNDITAWLRKNGIATR